MSLDVLAKNKDIVSRWIDVVFNQKDVAAIDALKVASYLDWTPFPGQRPDLPVSGLKESLPQFLSSLPDFHFTADEMIAEGDLVVCRGSWHATHTGEHLGIPPTGRQVSGTRIDIFRIAGDKMAEHWGCGGELGFLQLLGALPVTEQEKTPAIDNKLIVRRFVEEVINQRNLATLDELVDDHAIGHSQQSLATFFILIAFPDYRITIEDVLAEGDKITVISSFRGTHQGEFMGIAPTGKQVSGTRIDFFHVSDGKVVESWLDCNSVSLVKQINT